LAGCEIHVFDPFNGFLKGQNLFSKSSNIFVHNWGISSIDETITIKRQNKTANVTMKSLPTIVSELMHRGKRLDILKVDIEGNEFDIFDDEILWEALRKLNFSVNQFLLEVHFQKVNKVNFKWRNSSLISGQQMDRLLRVISKQGFAIFHKTVNSYSVAQLIPCEFAFINLGYPPVNC
jgi:hypothetical protein